MKMGLRETIKESLTRNGSYSKTIGGIRLELSKQGKEFWIKLIEKGQKPRLWIYRREHIALDRFQEQASGLRRIK